MADDELLSDYKHGMVIFKQLLEHIFGEDGRYTVDDGEYNENSTKILFNGDVDGIASYNAQLEYNRSILVLFFYYDLYNENLKVKSEEIREEIEKERLDSFLDNEPTVEILGDDDTIEYNVIIEYEPLFADAENSMFAIREIDKGIKKIIKKHRK